MDRIPIFYSVLDVAKVHTFQVDLIDLNHLNMMYLTRGFRSVGTWYISLQ